MIDNITGQKSGGGYSREEYYEEDQYFGGSRHETDLFNQIIIPGKSKIVVDGHNMIYQYFGKHLNRKELTDKKTFRKMVLLLHNAMPYHEVHVVLKNTSLITSDKKEYLKILKEMSVQNPEVNIHLAMGTNQGSDVMIRVPNKYWHPPGHIEYDISNGHHKKGRDDLLTIYLAKDGYLLTRDYYGDYKYFSGIAPFEHYHWDVRKNKLFSEHINPVEVLNQLKKPNIGTQFRYVFMKDKEMSRHKYVNGGIYVDRSGSSSIMYLKYN